MAGWAVRRPLPDYDATASLPDLQADVTIKRDNYGVPNIQASTETDLYRGMGYVQAQDRFVQMDGMRRAAEGRLAESIGDRDGAVDSDRLALTLGWRELAEKEWQGLDASTRSNLQAFADGVNDYLRDRGAQDVSLVYPLRALGDGSERLDRWEPVDSIAVLKMVAWESAQAGRAELARAQAFSRLGDAGQVEKVIVPGSSWDGSALGGTAIGVSASATANDSAIIAGDLRNNVKSASMWYQVGLFCDEVGETCGTSASGISLLGVPGIFAGRAHDVGWALSPGRDDMTDLFLEKVTNQQYETPDGPQPIEEISRSIPVANQNNVEIVTRRSQHGPIISDVDKRYLDAWMSPNGTPEQNDTDLSEALEDNDASPTPTGTSTTSESTSSPTSSASASATSTSTSGRRANNATSTSTSTASSSPSNTRTKSPSPTTTRTTDDEEDLDNDEVAPATDYDKAVAISWAGDVPGQTPTALLEFARARSVTDIERAGAKLDDFSFTMLVGEQSSVRAVTTGQAPMRSNGEGLGISNGAWPRAGWDEEAQWEGRTESAEIDIPTSAEVVVASETQVVAVARGEEMPTDIQSAISERVIEAVSEKPQTVESLASLQADTKDMFAQRLVAQLLQTPLSDPSVVPLKSRDFVHEALQELQSWCEAGCQMNTDVHGATYYAAVWSILQARLFEQSGVTTLQADGSQQWATAFSVLLDEPDNPWWDDPTTPTVVERRDQVLAGALHSARVMLTTRIAKSPQDWQWGKVHRMSSRESAIGIESMSRWIGKFSAGGDHEIPGGATTLAGSTWNVSDSPDFRVERAPVVRFVSSTEPAQAGAWVVLNGISGHAFSSHRDDQAEHWRKGESVPWYAEWGTASSTAEATTSLVPAR